MTANEIRKRNLASLTLQARAMREEAWRGFTDHVWEGRIIATKEEIEASAWRLICDCESQAEKLKGKIR